MGRDRQTLFIIANLWTIFAWFTSDLRAWIIVVAFWCILAQVYVRDWMRRRRVREKTDFNFNINEVIKDAEIGARRHIPEHTAVWEERDKRGSVQEPEES